MNTTGTLYLFATNDIISGPAFRFVGRIGNVRVRKGGLLVRIFIPVRRNSDNVLGMYDTVSNTFFTNSGSGTFIAGPDMNSNLYLPTGN